MAEISKLVPIILATIAITLMYLLYSYFSLKPTTISTSADLNSTTDNVITIKSAHTRYAYGGWLYVKSLPIANSKQYIFNRPDNISLSLSGTRPTLTCNITTATATPNTVVPVIITDNFPMQKWTHVMINVDNSYIDCYLDGKLIKSKRVNDINGNGPLVPTADNSITLGTCDAQLTKFKYWETIISPEDAWTEYKSGNGQSTFGNTLSNYGADIQILKDGIEQTSFSM